jgi:cytochrome c2
MMRRVAILLAALAPAFAACNRPNTRHDAMVLTGGDPDRGVNAIGRYGCGSCHTIPGIRGANALVGPPLNRIARRSYLAGEVQNTPANMVRWIQHPQRIEKGTVMPEMGVTENDARDIAAYLYTLR